MAFLTSGRLNDSVSTPVPARCHRTASSVIDPSPSHIRISFSNLNLTTRTVKGGSDDSARLQALQLGVVEAEQALEDLVVVLALDRWCGVVLDGRLGELDRVGADSHRAGQRMRHLDRDAAMLHLRVLEHLLEIVDGAGRNAGGLH